MNQVEQDTAKDRGQFGLSVGSVRIAVEDRDYTVKGLVELLLQRMEMLVIQLGSLEEVNQLEDIREHKQEERMESAFVE